MKAFTSSAIILTLGLFTGTAAANDYLVHNVNDVSTYAQNTSKTESRVVASNNNNWKKYSDFLGNNNQWVWTGNSNQIWLYNESKDINYKFVDLNAAIGTEANISFDTCTTKSKVTNKNLSFTSNFGVLNNVVEVSFSGPCADAGLTVAYFAPGFGVVSYSHSTIAGPQTFQLESANIGGISYNNKATGISVSMNYPRNKVILDEQASLNTFMTIKNNSDSDYSLNFQTSQTFNIEIFDNTNQMIYSWAENKRFLQRITTIVIPAGAEHTFGTKLLLQEIPSGLLDVGTYSVKLTLTGSEKQQASSFNHQPLSIQFPIHIDRKMTHY
ncbi:BsuPI-related putative proteinase inhibitor [Rheinheimera sp. WS51]|uniref:BsuPI-related putative proteinase inhibitor n=1 Tax=Rheinheimera sp. WS51 TaxID=3425886 RepID=UPI003D90D271